MSKNARHVPRRSYPMQEVIRAAYLAGSGASASDIAAELGSTTPDRVNALLHKHRVKLLPKAPGQTGIVLAISRTAVVELNKIAVARRMDPNWMIARVVEACAAERALLLNLLDEVEAP